MASDFNFTLDEYIQKKNMAEKAKDKAKEKATTFDDIDAELDLMVTDGDVDLDLDLGEDEAEINASSITVNSSSSNNSQVAEQSFDLRHRLDGLMVEPESSRTMQNNNNKKKNKNRRCGNNYWNWRNRNNQQKSNFNNCQINQRNGQYNNRNGNFRPKPNNCHQFRQGPPKMMICGPVQLTQKARSVVENSNAGGQVATNTSNGSLKSLLGNNEANSSEMLPVLAAKFLELIKGNGLQQTIHKPVYDMKIQQDIHRLQHKPLTYKCPGGEVVSSDGAGIQNCIIKPNASGISMNYRFA